MMWLGAAAIIFATLVVFITGVILGYAMADKRA